MTYELRDLIGGARPSASGRSLIHFGVLAAQIVPGRTAGGDFPLESSQRPLFASLGTPEKDKRLVLIDGGHVVPRSKDLVREALDWFDRYLGPNPHS